MTPRTPERRWTFLTNHAHVLLCLASAPDRRLRDVALDVGITERAVQRIVADLEEGGYLARHRAGRQNAYEINPDGPMRHRVEAHATVRALIALVEDTARSGSITASAAPRERSGRTRRVPTRPRSSR